MTLLAHWKLGDGRQAPAGLVAADSAAGGSGAHDGDYTFAGDAKLYPGGIGGARLFSTEGAGTITNILNPSDLRALHGSLTIMMWLHPWDENQWWTYAGWRRMFTCTVASWATEADNAPWGIFAHSSDLGKPQIQWEYGASPTLVQVKSTIAIPEMLYHLAVQRYEISPGYYGVKFFYDGVLVETLDNSGPGWPAPTGGANTLPQIGRAANSLNDFYCRYWLDSVRIYDTEESEENILSVFEAENAIKRPETIEEGPFSSRIGAGYSEGLF